MKRGILITFIFSIFISSLFSQDSSGTRNEAKGNTGNIPAQALYSNKVYIDEVYFNRITEPLGKGEILEVSFELKSRVDEPQDIYIYVLATFENTEPDSSSFDMPIPQEERIKSFVPYPLEDSKNYEYPDPENKNKTILIKYPKNSKTGIDPATGKPYHLVDFINIRTKHLSRYRNNFFFFNWVTILIFDKDGSPIFRQLYELSGKRT